MKLPDTMKILLFSLIFSIGGCLPYLTENRSEAIVDKLDVDQTLIVAQMELQKGGTGSQLTLWAIRDQYITAGQAVQISEIYFKYIESMKSDFDIWHLTWAISNMYRLGEADVKEALESAFKDATARAAKMGGAADKLVNGKTVKMGDAHGGGRAYAKGHLIAPGNPQYLQSLKDYDWREGRSSTHDPFWGPPQSRDFTPQGQISQPSFLSGGGQVAKNERAFVLTIDGELIPPAIMAGYRYGITNGWEIGIDIGGDYGVFQALLNTKIQNFKTVRSERFYWGTTYCTGYKYHKVNFAENFEFDDNSWVFVFDNTFALRLGQKRTHALFLASQFYIDIDLRTPQRQTDYYLTPAMIGYEQVVGTYGNFFVQAGAAYSINGMETATDVLYKNGWFPVIQIGMGYRTGDRTSLRYTKESSHMASRKAGKLSK